MGIHYSPWEDQVKPSGDNIPGSTVVNATFGPMYEPSLFVVLPYLGSEDYMFKTTSQPHYKFCLCEASSS